MILSKQMKHYQYILDYLVTVILFVVVVVWTSIRKREALIWYLKTYWTWTWYFQLRHWKMLCSCAHFAIPNQRCSTGTACYTLMRLETAAPLHHSSPKPLQREDLPSAGSMRNCKPSQPAGLKYRPRYRAAAWSATPRLKEKPTSRQSYTGYELIQTILSSLLNELGTREEFHPSCNTLLAM